MAAANEVIVRKLRKTTGYENALRKYARLGKIFVDDELTDDDNNIDGFISYLNEMTKRLNLPGLKSSGVEEAALGKICASTDIKNNPVKLDENDLLEIISKRFT
jgi:alcohol dehydrogenase class IV